jgi:ferredoxin--NADP+ reductase
MPYRIAEKTRLNSVMWKIKVEAPGIARAARPGQFVVLRIDEKGERIPLTINDAEPADGRVTIIFQEAGKTTKKLGLLENGDSISDLIGPLGKATHFGKAGRVALVAGGVGIAEILPIAKYLKENPNHVLTIIGARTRELLIMEEELKQYSDKLVTTTDDGSYGLKGLVTAPLKEALDKERFDLCYCVGPDIMMKTVCGLTKAYGLKTMVSLDANMIDATGMCGTCRVKVGDKILFTCVDGPEFDGHLIDWDGFLKRQKRFAAEEKRSSELFQPAHKDCRYRV